MTVTKRSFIIGMRGRLLVVYFVWMGRRCSWLSIEACSTESGGHIERIVIKSLRERHLFLIFHLVGMRGEYEVPMSLRPALAHARRVNVKFIGLPDVSVFIISVMMMVVLI